MSGDPFDTGGLRAAVLSAWRASPARLREDANTEEDHARGWYRDRVLVDLAQNGADAAVRAGVPGRLLLQLTEDDAGAVLVVANTGQPLDVAGVAALATMRASAKRDAELVGRFGVGFAAVRAVGDEVEVRSRTGSVRFSLAATRAALADVPAALATEVARRGDWLPVLRLPFTSQQPPPTGYDTAVVVRLRDEAALASVAAQLADVGDPLLLALPGLVEVVVQTPDAPPRRVADVAARWQVRTSTGRLDRALLADRPVEERERTRWQVTWARPRDPGTAWPPVLHAPTPTDDPCSLPALLLATLPLDPTRRRVVPGPLLDAIVQRAAAGYAALVAEHVASGGDGLALVPTGLAAGEVDALLRAAVLAALRTAPVLAGPTGPVPPDRALALAGPPGQDADLVAALAAWLPALVVLRPGDEAAARTLGVSVRALADVVDELPAAPGPWRTLYAACAVLLPAQAEALATVPVLLADGRVVRGARGTLLVDPDLLARLAAGTLDALAGWGVRVLDPAAAHPVLERLGATAADAAALLRDPHVRAGVLHAQDDPDGFEVGPTAAAVLDLVAAALPPAPAEPDGGPDDRPGDSPDGGPDDRPGDDRPDGVPRDEPSRAGPVGDQVPAWLGLVELPAADGEPTPASGLVLPGSFAHRLFDDRVLAPVASVVVDRWGERVLRAVGVRSGPVLVRVPDVVADPLALDLDGDDDAALTASALDGFADWLAELARRLGPGTWVGDVAAVADLDAVGDDAWPQLLARLTGDRVLREALVTPVRGDGGASASSSTAPSYTAWWLTTRSGLRLPSVFALAADVLPGLLPRPPAVLAGLDVAVRRALGGVADAAQLPARAWGELLAGLGPVGSSVPRPLAVQVWRGLTAAVRGGARPVVTVLPALVDGDRVVLVEVADAVVADTPMWWQRTDLGGVLPVAPALAAALAEALDAPLASELADGRVESTGRAGPLPPALRGLLADGPGGWLEHDDLVVDGLPVTWWVDGEGTPHAVHLAGLAAALAQVGGDWAARWRWEAVLADPTRAAEALLDQAVLDQLPTDRTTGT